MIDHVITPEDAPHLARLHQRAFPDFFLSRLGEPFLVQFYLGFVDDPTAVIVVVRDDNRCPQGVAVGTTDAPGFFGRLLRRRLGGFIGASARAVLRHPSTAPRLLQAVLYRGDVPRGREGALFSSMCVDPTLAGNGIGSALIANWTQRARTMGAERAFLTTDAEGNDVVNAWYRREGWVVTDEFIAAGGRAMNRYEFHLRALDSAT